MRFNLFACNLLVLLGVSSASYSFLTLGDWGAADIEEYEHDVATVAAQLAKSANSLQPAFLINTGDNFYWCGIQNTSDAQVQADWIEPYNLGIPWFSVLGNHEYGYNVQAQIDLGKIYATWVMDSRYYSRRVQLDATNYVSMIFMDSSPCVQDYRNNNPSYWDPCGTSYPTCSLGATDDDFEGTCEFHNNILSQDCSLQYDWLSQQLDNIPKDDWLIVVGHHPLDEMDVMDFTSLVQKHGFSIYLNGHTHALIHYTIDNVGAYVTSGAGGLVNTPDQKAPITAAKHRAENVTSASVYKDGMMVKASHSYQTVYYNKIAGFTQHTFNDDFTTLTTEFISYNGTVLHSFVTDKTGKYV